MTKTELLQYWFDEVWSNGNLSVIDEMLTPDTQLNGVIAAQALPKNDYPDLVLALRNLLGPIKVRLVQTMEQGDWISARMVVDTERAGTGERFQVTGQLMTRFEGSRIAETHTHFDFFSLFEKLGQLPPDALPVCMTGQRLTWV
ncbi:ester cyclase [Roseobacteraceae bacterium NS-SX3]